MSEFPACDDLEIQMHIFRMLRSGRYYKATVLQEDLQKDFPNESKERLHACARSLCERLLKQ